MTTFSNLGPREELRRRQLVREYHRRLRYVKQRLREMPIEVAFVEGRLRSLPAHIAKMPDWTRVAAVEGSCGVTNSISHLKPKPGRPYSTEDLAELLGYMHAMVTYIHNPGKEQAEIENDVEDVRAMRTRTAKQVEKAFLRFVQKITVKQRQDAPALTAPELMERSRRYTLGMERWISRDGELQGFRTLTVRINYLLWMFRHDFPKGITASSIHSWLRREHDESPSDKLVERIVTKLRKGPGKRRNPNRARKALGK